MKAITEKQFNNFVEFASKRSREIKNLTPDVMSELYALMGKGKFKESVCLGQSSIFACWIGNKDYFSIKNRIKNLAGNDYKSRIMRTAYQRYLKDIGAPTIAVTIPRENNTLIQFAITCPFYDTNICILKNFTFTTEKEKI